ncbi:hypothetical protein GCM10009128_16330 [Psychrosphaera haliotis]|uniref:hypothetical protein n=1 Tax=Psychrosphaera haliotis TaxID=555083 RepID=UPI0031D8FA42
MDKQQTGVSIKTYAASFNATNIQPIKAVIDGNWEQVVSDNSDFGISQSKVGLAIGYSNWMILFETRNDHFLSTNPSSALLYHYSKTDFPANISEYDLNIHYQKLQAKGIKVGYEWQLFNRLSMTNVIGFWQPKTHRNSLLTGDVESTPEVTGSAHLLEWYSYKNLLKRPIDKTWSDGKGQSWDVNFHWQPVNNLTLDFGVLDLVSEFKFDHIGYSAGTLQSSTTYRDENNILRFNPAYSGVETEKSYMWKMPKTIYLNASYKINDIEYYLAHEKRFLNKSAIIGAGIKAGSGQVRAGYDLSNKSLQLKYQNSWIEAGLVTDKLEIDKSKVLSFTLAASMVF